MYSRILVPLDGSSLSEQVLPYVRQMALVLSVPVTVMTVAESPEPAIGHQQDPGNGEAGHAAHRSGHTETYLESVAEGLRSSGLTVSTSFGSGKPEEAIVEEADRVPDSLIAMSSHGRSGIARWWLGSVTDRVLHLTDKPLLIVRSHPLEDSPHEYRINRVLTPLDGSPLAEGVLPQAMHIAKGLGLPVDLVRVIPTLQEYAQLAVAPGMYNPSLERLSEEVAQEASQYLGRIQERLQQEGAESVEVHLFRGHAAECIIDMASEIPDTLVAMTTHGRSGVGRWVLGSVADRVVRHSGAPVLVVHGTEAEGG